MKKGYVAYVDYLGDGVHAHFDGFNVVLATAAGDRFTNTICLDPDVLKAFEDYVAQLREELEKGEEMKP